MLTKLFVDTKNNYLYATSEEITLTGLFDRQGIERSREDDFVELLTGRDDGTQVWRDWKGGGQVATMSSYLIPDNATIYGVLESGYLILRVSASVKEWLDHANKGFSGVYVL